MADAFTDWIKAVGAVAPCQRIARKGFEISEDGKTFTATTTSCKAADEQSDDGVIIGRVSVAGNFDREKERVLERALKAATWELVTKVGLKSVAVDCNHEEETIGCDIVGVRYDYDSSSCEVHFRPHDRAHYEAAKSGEIVGFSWSGPYSLKEAEL